MNEYKTTNLDYADINPVWKALPIVALVMAFIAFLLVCGLMGKLSGEREQERRDKIDNRIRQLEESINQERKAKYKAPDESPAQKIITNIVHTERVFAPVAISLDLRAISLDSFVEASYLSIASPNASRSSPINFNRICSEGLNFGVSPLYIGLPQPG